MNQGGITKMGGTINELEIIKSLAKEKILACTIIQGGHHILEYNKNNKIKYKQHKINSCTKSILSLLIGVAFDKGYIHNLHLPIGEYFPKEMQAQHEQKRKKLPNITF